MAAPPKPATSSSGESGRGSDEKPNAPPPPPPAFGAPPIAKPNTDLSPLPMPGAAEVIPRDSPDSLEYDGGKKRKTRAKAKRTISKNKNNSNKRTRKNKNKDKNKDNNKDKDGNDYYIISKKREMKNSFYDIKTIPLFTLRLMLLKLGYTNKYINKKSKEFLIQLLQKKIDKY
jgi:hypothetical protein